MKSKSVLFLSLLLAAQGYASAHGSCTKCSHNHTQDQSGASHWHRSGIYVQGNVGIAIPTGKAGSDYIDSFKAAGVFGAGVGFNFNSELSADLAVAHRSKFKYADTTGFSQSVSSTSAMLTGYYTFPTKTISPYMAAGIGIAFNKAGNVYNRISGSDINGKSVSSFAWQAGTGIKFKASESVVLDLGYRYVDSGLFKTGTQRTIAGVQGSVADISGRLKTHEVLLGIRYNF